MSTTVNLYGLFLSEIADCVTKLKMEKFRAAQIAEWMYKRGVTGFAEMTNLPLASSQPIATALQHLDRS